ncbi:hypothetical protein L249_6677 [Ophiocordyceps polyrhachis-furcata BCC 54312]|uniref:SMODS and SLOG-associating 2TM effector domain-containing protein n=1 Tax=Ophiocordyceps polyrhachis-furcata BCC 54312 TaxID=1330021 RepID=A0A367LKX5_9HYPO|nr:hypothetical protein L249_6677 [Ophiocordyceps polyrhachis-furcata BCC 54312]
MDHLRIALDRCLSRIVTVVRNKLSLPDGAAAKCAGMDSHLEAGYGGPSCSTSDDGRRRRPNEVVTTDTGALVPINDKLLVFRSLAGIDTVPVVQTSGHTQRAAPNVGLYARAVDDERNAAQSFRFFNTAVNVCLGLQIVFSAFVTALGASSGGSKAVTAFGAMNTIAAGILTYLKGKGLPGKLKDSESHFKAVREFTEQREREFCLENCTLEPIDEVEAARDMYNAARDQSPTTRGKIWQSPARALSFANNNGAAAAAAAMRSQSVRFAAPLSPLEQSPAVASAPLRKAGQPPTSLKQPLPMEDTPSPMEGLPPPVEKPAPVAEKKVMMGNPT